MQERMNFLCNNFCCCCWFWKKKKKKLTKEKNADIINFLQHLFIHFVLTVWYVIHFIHFWNLFISLAYVHTLTHWDSHTFLLFEVFLFLMPKDLCIHTDIVIIDVWCLVLWSLFIPKVQNRAEQSRADQSKAFKNVKKFQFIIFQRSLK